MSEHQRWTDIPGDAERELLPFDNDDVEVGEEAPAGDTLTEEELAAIRAGQADPATPPADAEVS